MEDGRRGRHVRGRGPRARPRGRSRRGRSPCGAPAARLASSCAPVRTPTTAPAPARVPASRSLTVSPTTATVPGSRTPRRAIAPRIRSGAGRPRPTSAGESARSTSPSQASAASRASLVDGAKPVVRHTRTPRARSCAQHAERAGDRLGAARGDRGLVGPGELGGGASRLPRGEERGEHVGLGPAHGGAHHGGRLGRSGRTGKYPPGVEGVLERGLDRAVVAHGRAGHIEAGEEVPADHAGTARPAASSVPAAMAGAQVMPRPPGPVTRTTRSAISSRRHTPPSRRWA